MSLVSKVFITYPRELSSCGTYAWGWLPGRVTDQNTRFTLSCLFAAEPAILNALVLSLKILYWTVKTPFDSLSDQERRSKQRPDRTNQSWKVLWKWIEIPWFDVLYARTFHSLPTIRASLTTLTFNVYLLHPTVHFIATLHFYSTHDESLVRGDFQSIFLTGFTNFFS